ncbi:MAG: dihydrodipicolinate synthase family protein [Actinobacteria bacterium]|nr:dihydrodipicolinate synthase family protein [Actinomycetota bacterium]
MSITPFDARGDVDESALRSHLERLADAGVGVYLAGGGSGEGFTLDLDEMRTIFRIGVEVLGGRVPVRAMGYEPHTAGHLREILLAAQDAGVDATQVYSLDGGHVFRPSVAEMRRYYTDVLEGVEIPIVLSTHPSVGYALPISLLEDLCREYPVVGINVTTNEIPYLADMLAMVRSNGWLGDRISVQVGGEMHGLTNLALGGQGIVSSMGNLVPRLLARMHTDFAAGEYGSANDAYARLIDIYNEFTKLGGTRTRGRDPPPPAVPRARRAGSRNRRAHRPPRDQTVGANVNAHPSRPTGATTS